MNAITTLPVVLSDPALELPSDAARLHWLRVQAESVYRSLKEVLNDEELLSRLCRTRINDLDTLRTIVRRRGGLEAVIHWMTQPNDLLDGATPADELEWDQASVLDAAQHDPHDADPADEHQLASAA